MSYQLSVNGLETSEQSVNITLAVAVVGTGQHRGHGGELRGGHGRQFCGGHRREFGGGH